MTIETLGSRIKLLPYLLGLTGTKIPNSVFFVFKNLCVCGSGGGGATMRVSACMICVSVCKDVSHGSRMEARGPFPALVLAFLLCFFFLFFKFLQG